MSTKVLFSLDVNQTVGSLLENSVLDYIVNKKASCLAVINGVFHSENTMINFKIKNCNVGFFEKKIIELQLPEKPIYEIENFDHSEFNDLIATNNIQIPNNLTPLIRAEQLESVEKIISNQISALSLSNLSSSQVKILSKFINSTLKPNSLFKLLQQDADSYLIEAIIELGEVKFKSIIKHYNSPVDSYQTHFHENWKAINSDHNVLLTWIAENQPEIMLSTEGFHRPLSALHYRIKEFIESHE